MISSQRHLFDIPDDVAYFNMGYLSPLSHAVVAAGEAGLRRKTTPWKMVPDDFFSEPDKARSAFGRLIGANAEDIFITPSASYGVSVAAANLPLKSGQYVLVLEEQFPSNVYPWRELAAQNGGEIKTVARPEDDDWTAAVLSQLDGNCAVAALPHCHWTDGGLLDLVAIGARCREVGAALALDLTQSLGALLFSVADIQPDFLVAACYKWLMGPYSVGFAYAAPHRQEGKPLEYSWFHRVQAEDFTGLLNYRDAYRSGAQRYDMGEFPNFALMPAAIAALDQLLNWGIDEIQATLAARNADIAERGLALGLTTAPDHLRAGHFLGLRFPGGVPDGMIDRLAKNNVLVSIRGAAMRITPHVYNTDADVDKLFEVLEPTLS